MSTSNLYAWRRNAGIVIAILGLVRLGFEMDIRRPSIPESSYDRDLSAVGQLGWIPPMLPDPRWIDAGVPVADLLRLDPGSDAHWLFAEYANTSPASLLALLTTRLTAAGYSPTCTGLDGLVHGFEKGADRFAAVVDGGAGVAGLRIVDAEAGRDHPGEMVYFMVCFGSSPAPSTVLRSPPTR